MFRLFFAFVRIIKSLGEILAVLFRFICKIRIERHYFCQFYQHFTRVFFGTKFWRKKLQSCVLGLQYLILAPKYW